MDPKVKRPNPLPNYNRVPPSNYKIMMISSRLPESFVLEAAKVIPETFEEKKIREGSEREKISQ
ncbi:conserved hypothetical protein [Ricinus communis]|uniref:Uncharacterized protein n=1 Tax=Ricinus communis TaxID=3988 RepID=B9SG68_RICCO|nr:conserved hypothetical protein [Ricinus communis]